MTSQTEESMLLAHEQPTFLCTDLGARIIEGSHEASSLLNVPSHHLGGKPLANFVAAEGRIGLREAMAHLRAGADVSDFPLAIQPRRKAAVLCTASARALVDGTGNLAGFVWRIVPLPARPETVETTA